MINSHYSETSVYSSSDEELWLSIWTAATWLEVGEVIVDEEEDEPEVQFCRGLAKER